MTVALVGLLTLGITLASLPALAGTSWVWIALAVTNAVAAALALRELHAVGKLASLVRPKAGDLSLGAIAGAVLLALGLAARALVLEGGAIGEGWLYPVYLMVGDPRIVERSLGLTALLLASATGSEVVLRGAVYEWARARYGDRRAWLVTAATSGIVMSPTLFTLTLAGGTPSPLLVFVGVGLGLGLGLLRKWSERVGPCVVGHCVFLYFTVTSLCPPGLCGALR